MSVFLTYLVTEAGSGRSDRLHLPLRYSSDLLGRIVEVPAGFVTDYASVPRGLWNMLPPNIGPYREPAVVHDFLYRTQNLCDRKTADKVFLEAMKVKDCRWTQRYTMYRAVRWFGWLSWKKNRKALVNMKKTFALLIPVVFVLGCLTGCIHYSRERPTPYGTEKTSLTAVFTKGEASKINSEEKDGTYERTLTVGAVTTAGDPDAMKAFGEAVGTAAGAAAGEALKKTVIPIP